LLLYCIFSHLNLTSKHRFQTSPKHHTQLSHPIYTNHLTTFVYNPRPCHHSSIQSITHSTTHHQPPSYCPEQQHGIAHHARASEPLLLRIVRAHPHIGRTTLASVTGKGRGMCFVGGYGGQKVSCANAYFIVRLESLGIVGSKEMRRIARGEPGRTREKQYGV
jgi:hypothetical protein